MSAEASNCLKCPRQLAQWKEVNTWRLIIAGKESSAYGFCTFLFVQQRPFCTVYNKWLSPSMGCLGKKTHLEPIFGKVIILSRQSRWKSVHCLTKLQLQYFIFTYAPEIFSLAYLWKCIILDMDLPVKVPIAWIFSTSIKMILITFIRKLICGFDTRFHEIEKLLLWKGTLAWDREASIICANHWDVTHLSLSKLVFNDIMEVSTFFVWARGDHIWTRGWS